MLLPRSFPATLARRLGCSLTVTLGVGLGLIVAQPAQATERQIEPESDPQNRQRSASILATSNLQPSASQSSDLRSRLALLDQVPLPPPPVLPAVTVFAITPERRALLNTIRFAEGTWAEGHPIGYRILFGGSVIDRLDQHPNRVMRTRGYASAAAGAYQFMPFTWAMASRALGLSTFGPDHQDQAAIFLIQRRGALGLADQGVLTPELTARLAPEWASFPTLAGRSFYGQPVRRYALLRQFYENNLAALRAAAGLGDVAQAAKSCEESDRLCRLDRLGQRP